MDNDDFRRGRPTCHKVFGEGIAVLAGDALLTLAFEIVSTAKPAPRYDISILLREIAVAAGSQRLIAGQVADLEAEGRRVKRDQLRFIHENKTAAMLKSSVRLGAMSANADLRKLSAITRFGERLGLAFQVIDDILDVTQTSEILGKSAGKDVAAKKATYPAVIGLEKSRAEARRLTRQAHGTDRRSAASSLQIMCVNQDAYAEDVARRGYKIFSGELLLRGKAGAPGSNARHLRSRLSQFYPGQIADFEIA